MKLKDIAKLCKARGIITLTPVGGTQWIGDPDVAMFKLHFDNLQKTAASMAQLIIKMKQSGNADMADKLSRAACAVLERAKEELA